MPPTTASNGGRAVLTVPKNIGDGIRIQSQGRTLRRSDIAYLLMFLAAKLQKYFVKENQMEKNINWDATAFFEKLASSNKLAMAEGFALCRLSGLEGFEEALHNLQSTANFICVSDIAQGYTELNNTPHTRRVKTVFLAMRHALDNMQARQECMETMRELFRQFMSVLIQEKTRVEEEHIYLDPRISFQEIDSYFFSGCACAYFQIATDVYTDLRYNNDEWL